MTESFADRVHEAVSRIPRGRVGTYGQIAALIGKPGAAQAVGRAMHQMDREPSKKMQRYPWWRVINSKGYISTTCREHSAEVQHDLLARESIVVEWRDSLYWVDLKRYLWDGN